MTLSVRLSDSGPRSTSADVLFQPGKNASEKLGRAPRNLVSGVQVGTMNWPKNSVSTPKLRLSPRFSALSAPALPE